MHIAIPVMGSMQPANKIHGSMQEVDRRGVGDTSKVAVGGHSYGAFMAANLLVSSRAWGGQQYCSIGILPFVMASCSSLPCWATSGKVAAHQKKPSPGLLGSSDEQEGVLLGDKSAGRMSYPWPHNCAIHSAGAQLRTEHILLDGLWVPVSYHAWGQRGCQKRQPEQEGSREIMRWCSLRRRMHQICSCAGSPRAAPTTER